MSHSRNPRKKPPLLPLTMFVVLLSLLFYAFSESLHTVYYTITTDCVTDPIRLVLLTDLHSCYYGTEQEKLLSAIDKAKPDLVCFVGDMFDDEAPHDGMIRLLDGVTDLYPCYFVTGNHEHWSEEVWVLKALLTSYGVTVLAGDAVPFTAANGQTVLLTGIDDPVGFHETGSLDVPEPDSWLGQFAMVTAAVKDSSDFTILLSHRPEMIELYTDSPFDLVLSGHAHGGQIRIPFLMNGLFAPGQGYFPEHAGGRYTLGDTTLIVSRGLCKNEIPRIFNRPEVVVVDIVGAQ